MKILIGTPIHICKDYAMERWLENVSKLEYKADLLLVDNSPGLEYVEKVKEYCEKYRIKNYEIKHLEINQELNPHLRVEIAQETIRQEILSKDYDAWFSWECDQIIPINALDELIRIMKIGNFMIVDHNCWVREEPEKANADFGVTLVKRECLEKNSFLKYYDVNLNIATRWQTKEAFFKRRMLKDGGNYIEVFGIISPILHLNN